MAPLPGALTETPAKAAGAAEEAQVIRQTNSTTDFGIGTSSPTFWLTGDRCGWGASPQRERGTGRPIPVRTAGTPRKSAWDAEAETASGTTRTVNSTWIDESAQHNLPNVRRSIAEPIAGFYEKACIAKSEVVGVPPIPEGLCKMRLPVKGRRLQLSPRAPWKLTIVGMGIEPKAESGHSAPLARPIS